MKSYLLVLLVTAALTLAFTWIVWRVALRHKLYPAIRERDVHTVPTPRLGGIAMFLGVLAAFALSYWLSLELPFFAVLWSDPTQIWAVLGAVLLIVLVGVADDVWDLDWMIKLGAQFLAAGIVVGFGGIQIFALPVGQLVVVSSWQSFALSVLAIVVVMNAINFIDGLDGLVAGVALIANSIFFAYAYMVVRDQGSSSYSNLAAFLAIVLVAVCLGFLPFNWNPARMFMGDAGALMIGLLMATAAVRLTGSLDPRMLGDNDVFGRSQLLGAFLPILLPVVVVLLPLLDFGMAVVRRLARGKSPFSPDREHLHHRMLDMGHTDREAVLVFYAWAAIVGLGVLLMYLGTTRDWAGQYWAGVLYLLVGGIACVIVTVLPTTPGTRRRPAAKNAPTAP
ncbi:MraY family glycosyltransferase [Microbacterium sp. No. 7]|uniref:MraY family glycosyltransferase n=1 Tax=Microbacterium sp. No. 7 TaxID=1714373 RepID=UPI0006CFE16C|nr:MraY family glycosyltransferase [Microbacterium sp. No. 7]ALJ21168.1 UDP-N-acetylmuramyl pentapeptide phosphotransferase [Microbacterium sp. No. 7]